MRLKADGSSRRFRADSRPSAAPECFRLMTKVSVIAPTRFLIITRMLMKLIAPDLHASVSAVQGRQLSSADVRLLHRGRKQPGESQ